MLSKLAFALNLDIQNIVNASFQYGVISSQLPGEGSVNFKDSDNIIHGIVSSFVWRF